MLKSLFLIFAFGLTFAQASISSEEILAKANEALVTVESNKQTVVSFKEHIQYSAHGIHVYYSGSYQDLPLWGHYRRDVHFDQKLNLLSAKSRDIPSEFRKAFMSESDARQEALVALQAKELSQSEWNFVSMQRGYYASGTHAQESFRFRFSTLQAGTPLEYYVDVDGCSGRIRNLFPITFTHAQTTEAHGTIYRHNPVAGSGIKDGHSELAQARALVQVPLRGLDDSGFMRGAYVDLTAPDLPQYGRPSFYYSYQTGSAFSSNGQFNYAPDDLAFEEVMVYYWIDSAQRLLQEGGFSIFERPIQVNCHAFLGQNAFFDSNYRALFFGDGIVQSAEDASVITHEYGHAVLDDIVGSRFYDDAGSMFHEGFADYFSTVVAQKQSSEVGPDFFPEYLGEWFAGTADQDPPHLRSVLPPSYKYPTLRLESHEDGRLWSSAFYELDRALPNSVFFKLLLESLYETPSAYPADVIDALTEVEERLYHGQYRETILNVFRKRGLYEPESYLAPIALNLGQNLIQPTPEGVSYLKFTVTSDTNRLTLRMGVLDAPIYGVTRLAKGHIPDSRNFDKEILGEISVIWDLDRESSLPTLETGATYYLEVPHRVPAAIELEQNGSVLNPLVELSANQPWELNMQQNRLNRAKLVGLSGAGGLSIDAGHTSDNSTYILYLNPNRAVGPEDPEDPDTLSYYIRYDTGLIELELPPSYAQKDAIFLSCYSRNFAATTTSLSWSPRVPNTWLPLQVGTPVSGQLSLDGLALHRLEVSPENELHEITLSTDADHPFLVEGPEDQVLSSFLFNGRQTLLLHDSYPFSDIYTYITGFLEPGSYDIRVLGSADSEYSLTAEAAPLPMTTTLSTDQASPTHLESKELKIFQFSVPEDAFAFSLQFSGQPESHRLIYQFYTGNGQTTSFFNGASQRTEPYNSAFRQTLWEMPSVIGSLTPGMDYQVWVYNIMDVPVDLALNLELEANPPEIPALSDGTIVEFDWDVHSLYANGSYYQVYTINPPADAKSVLLNYEYLSGSRQMGCNFRNTLFDSWSGSLLGPTRLSEFELGFIPNHPFLVYFVNNNYVNHVEGPGRIQLSLSYDTEKVVNHVFEGSAVASAELTTLNTYLAEIKVPASTRGLEVAWRASNWIDGETLYLFIDRDRYPMDSGIVNTRSGPTSLFPFFGETELSPLPEQSLFLEAYSRHWDRFTILHPWATPLDAKLHVKYYAFTTESVIPPIPSLPAASLSQRRVMLINPTAETLGVSKNTESVTLPSGGFALETSSSSASMTVEAASPLVIFEYLAGPQWTTLAAPSPFQESSLKLPHLPPSSSPWLTQLGLSNAGSFDATLEAATLITRTQPPGSSEPILRGEQDLASWFQLQAAPESETSAFGDSSLSGQQYWTLDNVFAAERAGLTPSQTLYVPHVPNLNDWWLGISITNPSPYTLNITLTAYDAEGELLPEVGQFQLEGNRSKTGLLSDFYDYPGTSPTWLRIESEFLPIMGICFIGKKNQAGADVGCFALPQSAAATQYLPGALSEDWYGLAVVNPLNQNSEVHIEAVAASGAVLATLSKEIGPRKKELVIGSQAFSDQVEPYYVRVRSLNGRVLAIQLNGPNLSMQAGVPSH